MGSREEACEYKTPKLKESKTPSILKNIYQKHFLAFLLFSFRLIGDLAFLSLSD